MSNLTYSIEINAPRQKVWEMMLGQKTYEEWTGVFHEGSTYKGSWEKGSDIWFVSEDDGKVGGMAGKIAENIPNEFISIEYLGVIVDGKLDESEDSKKWMGSHENYTFTEKDGVTTIVVQLEGNGVSKEIEEMFDGMWPKALQKLKEIVEQ